MSNEQRAPSSYTEFRRVQERAPRHTIILEERGPDGTVVRTPMTLGQFIQLEQRNRTTASGLPASRLQAVS